MKRFTTLSMLATLLLSSAGLSADAQETPKAAFDGWRPRDGAYASPGKDFQAECYELNDMTLDLRSKSVHGYEWGCHVRKITTPSPGSMKLDMICDDYNLAQNVNPRGSDWETRRFKEFMFIKRIDDATVSVQKSLNGKLKGPPLRVAYCPLEAQQALAEPELRAKAEANAHPRDGVYAAAGADFEQRCSKTDDTAVSFSGKSITTASNICKIEKTRVQLPDTVRIGATCTPPAAAGPEAVSVQHMDLTPDRENLMFKKIDDKTVILWIINNGHFTGDGRKLSYCSDQVQRAFAGQVRTSKQTKN
ncbi:hypothetical protein ACQ86E_04395 [Bradyrhizobium betae]|uniref:hypothetical protein n=1 Tax=Bradyrhizobium betae TaxID=244734 RepID=UPI003D67DF9E